MYLAMNGLVAVGRLGAADGVDQRHAVVGEQIAQLAEVGARSDCTPTCSNMPTDTMRSKWPSTLR